ncbi:hypothetical protein [Aquitalea sp. ASV15]|uniref:hypothetical protein n=1 Tax=Aquitalea sp. ASV15 TaxID=2795104 RepID=UPI0018EAA1B0|nr:hypothetical protein [Aquitalea sp. ASV15]
MAEPQARPNANRALIVGRIKEARRNGEFTHTVILIPAADEFSMPGVCEISSKKRLGASGDDVQVVVDVTGYFGKSFQATDKETGERVTRRPVQNVLRAIEQ